MIHHQNFLRYVTLPLIIHDTAASQCRWRLCETSRAFTMPGPASNLILYGAIECIAHISHHALPSFHSFLHHTHYRLLICISVWLRFRIIRFILCISI
jgi:hypothetical protein